MASTPEIAALSARLNAQARQIADLESKATNQANAYTVAVMELEAKVDEVNAALDALALDVKANASTSRTSDAAIIARIKVLESMLTTDPAEAFVELRKVAFTGPDGESIIGHIRAIPVPAEVGTVQYLNPEGAALPGGRISEVIGNPELESQPLVDGDAYRPENIWRFNAPSD